MVSRGNVAETTSNEAGQTASHELHGVVLGPQPPQLQPGQGLLEHLEGGELEGSVGEDPGHLSPVPPKERPGPLLLDHPGEAGPHAQVPVEGVVRLQQDLDPVQGRHGGLGAHARHAARQEGLPYELRG